MIYRLSYRGLSHFGQSLPSPLRTSNKGVLKAHCAVDVTDNVAVVDAAAAVDAVVVAVVADLHRLFFCPKVLNWWRSLNKSGQIEFN